VKPGPATNENRQVLDTTARTAALALISGRPWLDAAERVAILGAPRTYNSVSARTSRHFGALQQVLLVTPPRRPHRGSPCSPPRSRSQTAKASATGYGSAST